VNARPVRRNAVTVRHQLARILEQQDPVAEQAPALFRMSGDDAGRIVVGGLGWRASRLMLAHSAPLVRLGDRLCVDRTTQSCT
jgi:hypothetical protein